MSNTHTPLVPAPPRQRLVSKDGRCLVKIPTPCGKWRKWSTLRQDLWGLWLTLRWRWVFITFCGSFLLHWLLFAVLWYLLARANGDLAVPDHENPPPEHVLCVKHVTGFTAAFSFALETQLTIGYGTMFPNADCPVAIALLAVQMLLGLMLEAFITGAFVAKFSRPQKRSGGIVFSPKACVYEEKGQVCVAFRVCNQLGYPLQDVCVRAVLYEETEDQSLRQMVVDFLVDGLGLQTCPLFLSSLTFLHPLAPSSPLSSALQSTIHSRFELVVFLSASLETGSAYQKRTSYLLSDFQLKRRFTTETAIHSSEGHIFDTIPCEPLLPSDQQDKDCVVQIKGEGSECI